MLGQMAVIPDPWIMSMIQCNVDIIPNKCRKVFLEVLQKGYITDSEKFSEDFNILLNILSGEGHDENLSPEEKLAVKEGRKLLEKRLETANLQKDSETEDSECHEVIQTAMGHSENLVVSSSNCDNSDDGMMEIPNPIDISSLSVLDNETQDENYYSSEEMIDDRKRGRQQTDVVRINMDAQAGALQQDSASVVNQAGALHQDSDSVVTADIPEVTEERDTALGAAMTSPVVASGARPKERRNIPVTNNTVQQVSVVSDAVQVQGRENVVLVADCAVLSNEPSPRDENTVNLIMEYTENIKLYTGDWPEGFGEWEDSDSEQQQVREDTQTVDLINECVTGDYLDTVIDEQNYNNVTVQFTNDRPVQVLVTTQAMVAAEPVTSPPSSGPAPVPEEVQSVREGETQYVLKTKLSKGESDSRCSEKKIRKPKKANKDDGKKPVKQLRIEAEEKKRVMKESGTWVEPKTTKPEKASVSEPLRNPSAGFAESVLGSRRIFIVTEGVDRSEKMKITSESGGRYYFKYMEDTKHNNLYATVVWNDVPQGKLCNMPWERQLVERWVAYKPHITVVTLGREDLISNDQVRQGYTFALAAKVALRQLVTEGERCTRQPMEIEEYRYRMKHNHSFILVTPSNLVTAVEGLETWRYDEIQKGVRQGLIAKRKDMHKENIFVTTPGRDLMFSIRDAVAKILCINCSVNYVTYSLYVKHFSMGGCDDVQGATALRERPPLSDEEMEI